jgi:hypothetical protein
MRADESVARDGGGGDVFVVKISLDGRTTDAYFVGAFDGRKFTPTRPLRRLDVGAFYASKSFVDEGGDRILFGWGLKASSHTEGGCLRREGVRVIGAARKASPASCGWTPRACAF